MTDETELPRIEDRIVVIRGVQVMVDSDLAQLYEVETKRLNQQVRKLKFSSSLQADRLRHRWPETRSLTP